MRGLAMRQGAVERLGAARDDHVRLARANRAEAVEDGVEAGAALAVDRRCRDASDSPAASAIRRAGLPPCVALPTMTSSTRSASSRYQAAPPQRRATRAPRCGAALVQAADPAKRATARRNN